MKPKSAIAKGKILEDFIVERLRISGLDTRAYRQKGSGSGLNKGDVWNALDIHFEAKNVDKMRWSETIRQVKRDNVGDQDEAIVWHRSNTPLEESLVCIEWHYYEKLLLGTREPLPELERGNLRFLIPQGRDVLRRILKEMDK